MPRVAMKLAKWQYAQEAWDQLQFGLRTRNQSASLHHTTLRPIGLIKQIISDPATVVTAAQLRQQGQPVTEFLGCCSTQIRRHPARPAELNAELLEDMEGALWKRGLIDALRVKLADVPPLERIVVAIDPNASSHEDANECGIGLRRSWQRWAGLRA